MDLELPVSACPPNKACEWTVMDSSANTENDQPQEPSSGRNLRGINPSYSAYQMPRGHVIGSFLSVSKIYKFKK